MGLFDCLRGLRAALMYFEETLRPAAVELDSSCRSNLVLMELGKIAAGLDALLELSLAVWIWSFCFWMSLMYLSFFLT